ncbi:TonB-dependent siderophore receptor [Neptuniibacter sp. CAU 1671]|uniref:TonB-dependent receptor n=1 Tax=Neptuniibacter sp. CAU 1671 TaxID=3032593 RepID=UPI0023DBB5BF|nr:TonB-dependent siderophore receptor [Neptuniibacter sp. CAU 1671]MDF2182816.1 TonB-dependent siderophore receptor [Neptuniibacter sp. CAU 1671]
MPKKTLLNAATYRTYPRVPASVSLASGMALAVSAALPLTALAEEVQLDALVVEDSGIVADSNPYAEPGAPYKAKKLSDSKHTRDIADTPQTMTVLTKDVIDESGKNELKDLLAAQPGITLGTGEGGNSFGDRYIIRGYEARSDVFTDGLREPGLITRDTFALEQVEISKGPSSTFAGRGTTGGAVNTVTKKASLDDDFNKLEGGMGTDDYHRFTFDANRVVNDSLAIRFNGLYSESDIPDRDPAAEERKGALLSAVFQATDDLKLAADYYFFRSDDRTDPGVAFDRDTQSFNRYDYVGQDGLDFQESGADIFTLAVDYQLTDAARLENKTRLGNTTNDYIITAYSAGRGDIRSFTGWQDNDYVGNQTNLIIDTELGGKRHTLVTGVEYAKEDVIAGNYAIDQTNTFTIDPYNADNNLWEGSTSKSDKMSDLTLKTWSIYLMDTITLNDDWELFGGVRYDHFDYKLWTAERERRGTIVPEARYAFSDGFWNGHLGVVFSPWENGNLYASWGTSSNINGGEADAGSSCGYGGLCSDSDGNYAHADPEQSTNWELGTKWNLMDEQLLLTAAIFRTTKDDVIEEGGDSYSTGGSLNTGKNRVEGVELGLSGNITNKLSGQFGIAVMNSETLESYDESLVGLPKANFAEKSASLQLKYQLTSDFAFGGNLTYASEMFGGQPDTGARLNIRTPGYSVVDLFALWQINPDMSLRANMQNVADKEYYTAIYRGGSIVYLGDARSANLTLSYRF